MAAARLYGDRDEHRGGSDDLGDDAHGIYAQSIGGTGGDGGSSGALSALGGGATNSSSGGAVKVVKLGIIATGAATSGTVLTRPDPTCGTGCSSGIFAQSIGGGGNGGATGGLISAIGGASGGGGSGGTVEVDNTANISTT